MPRRPKLMSNENLEAAAECLRVMAHPVRLRVVEALTQGRYAVHELADICEVPPHQMCEHLRLMKGWGLLASERDGRTVYYEILSPRLPSLLECIKKSCKA